MVGATRGEGVSVGAGQRRQEDVEKRVPVTWRGDIPLTGAHHSIKAPELLRGGVESERFSATAPQGVPRQRGADDGTPIGIIRDQ